MQPWQSEFALEETAVRGLLRDSFPELVVETIRYLHQGWDNFVFLVNGIWIFRFPKRADRARWVESELAILKLLRGGTPEIRVPVPEYVGDPGLHFPCRFMGYRLLPGTTGDRVSPDRIDRSTSARRLGELLTIVHGYGGDSAAASGILADELPLDDLLTETMTFRDVLLSGLPAEVRSAALPYLEGTCRVPKVGDVRRCLVHGDLLDEHVLIDGAGRVCAVIDWGDSCLSDPAQDFAGLYASLGQEFVRQVLAHYDRGIEPAFIEQVAFRARCLALTNFGWSLLGHATSPVDRMAMVLRAFA